MKKKQLAYLAMVTAAGLGLMTGCGGKTSSPVQGGAGNTQSGMSAGSDKNSMAAENESGKKKLTIAIQTNALVKDYDDNYFTKYLEDKLNMDIEFYQLPTSAEEVRTKVSLMATSNDNLPDILIVDNALTPETVLEYGNNGVFVPLNEYLSDPAKMPNYNAIPEEDRRVMEQAQTMANGEMYSLSKYEPEIWNLTPNRTFTNKAWLDKLGLKVPETTEELKAVLLAFKTQDPNGNGVQDELGVYGFQSGGYGQNITASLMNAFEFWNGGRQNGGLSLSEDGKTVLAPFTQEGWKEGLLYMNELYRQGVLAPSIFTDDETQFKATLNGEDNVVGLVSLGSLSNYPDAAKNKNFLEMSLIKPLKGPKGKQYTPYNTYAPSQSFYIFDGCEDMELAIRLADEFFEPTTSIISRFGEEGVDWTRDAEKLKGMSNSYTAAGIEKEITLAYISNFWLEPSSKNWHAVSPRYSNIHSSNTVANGMVAYNPEEPTQLNGRNYEYYSDKHPEKILPLLQYTEEEAGEIQEALANIPIYVNQTMAEFITGARDINSGWDAYLKELNGMGLEQWLKTAQAAYDRAEK